MKNAVQGDATQDADECTLPESLRAELIFEYSLERFPFPTLVCQQLSQTNRGSSITDLSQLHGTPEAQNWLEGVLLNGSRGYALRRNAYDRRFKSSGSFRTKGSALQDCYLAFLTEVVAPLVADGTQPAEGDKSPTLIYQRDPNFRAHLPGTRHLLVHKHRDADYFHQPNEVNFWIPLTECRSTNTVWVESSPGRGDFRPFELRPGQGLRFWGNQCEHYTVPNETNTTRCSFDFRVLPSQGHYRERYTSSHRSDGLPRFALGAFFDELPLRGLESASA
jgi:hypothetical protein